MSIGKLDKKIELEAPVEVNNQGDVQISWGQYAEVWAEIISQRGDQAFEAARLNSQQMLRVRIRYRDDLTTKDRMLWEGQIYKIRSVDRTGRRKGYLWFTAEANLAA